MRLSGALRRSVDLLAETRRVGPARAIARTTRAARCEGCGGRLDLYGSCPGCGRAARLTAREWIDLICDPASFAAGAEALVVDPLEFRHEAPYLAQLEHAREQTGLAEAVVAGTAEIAGRAVTVCAFDFRFLGGSLGVEAGERIVVALQAATAERSPVVLVVASSGARMQEGLAALFQMARTSAAAVELRKAGVPFLALLTDPTTGAPFASVANLADVVLAERGALVGFAGPRVVEAVTGAPAQGMRAEELGERGVIDASLPRPALRRAIVDLLDLLTVRPPGTRERLPELSAALPPADRWALVQAIREPRWPSGRAWLDALASRSFELHGDRTGIDDQALVTALARIGGERVVVIAQDRHAGDGLITPAGYRKALRALRIAARLDLPVLTIIDGPGAAVGRHADEHGIAYWLAECFAALLDHPTPVVTLVVGQGSSGGAIALAAADRIFMLERSIFTVIAPEGAAAIISRDAGRAADWAEALRLAAADALALGLVDGVVAEPRAPLLVQPQRVRRVRALLASTFAELRANQLGLAQARRVAFIERTRNLARHPDPGAGPERETGDNAA